MGTKDNPKPKKLAWLTIQQTAIELQCTDDNVYRLTRGRAKGKKPPTLRTKVENGRKLVNGKDIEKYKESDRKAGRPKEST